MKNNREGWKSSANGSTMVFMKTIYLVRHGETPANRDEVFRGRYETPLGENGVEQAKSLVDYFEKTPPDKVYCSPLERAVDTARIGFPGADIEVCELINNLDLGSWTGVEKAEIRRRDPASWQMWATEPEKIHFPEGETLADVYSRVEQFLGKIEKEPFERLAVVSHRSVIKVILAAALGLETNYYWRFHIDNASVSVLALDEARGFTLMGLNDTNHLKEFVVEWF